MVNFYDLSMGAKRLMKVEASPIRMILDQAAALRAKGISVIPFSAGEPDFNTPSEIKEATIRSLLNNDTHYTSNRGYAGLRSVLSNYIQWETGVSFDPEEEILITSGGAEALNNTILAFVDEGDEVIVLSPAFISYKNLSLFCGAKFVEVSLDAGNGFQIDIGAVEAAITERTKLLILNNPNNPTGAVFTRDALSAICKLAVEHNFLILSDEMYSRLVYDGAQFYSIASFEGMKEHAILVSGFSKTFAMTGWRLGYIAANARLSERILRMHQYSSTCSPTFIQVGVAEAMDREETRSQVTEMIAAFASRRRQMMQGLDEIERLSYVVPYGAFYIMVNVSALGMSGETFAKKLLEEKNVATVPAAGLGKDCQDYIRISYATSEENIAEGLRRIRDLTKSIQDNDSIGSKHD